MVVQIMMIGLGQRRIREENDLLIKRIKLMLDHEVPKINDMIQRKDLVVLRLIKSLIEGDLPPEMLI